MDSELFLSPTIDNGPRTLFFFILPITDNGLWTMVQNGLYNLGTGTARSFNDLVKSTFAGLNLSANIEFINMPEDIRDKYQYFTEANMKKLRDTGYTKKFYSLEEGIIDYVQGYLKNLKYF